jgi:ankyrin repeat protein
MARDINLGCAMSCAHHFCRHSVCYSCISANLVSQMVLDRRLLNEYSARYSIFVELLIFITNECAPPTRVKKTINPGWRWEDQEEAVMSACSSLVTIVKDGDWRVVQFSHFSVKEFLTADRLAEPIRDVTCYHIRLEAAHTILAQACLGVILRLDDRVDRESIKNFPMALYAAQYWPTHARVENVSSFIKDGMECLFDAEKRHFSTWLWIYDEDQPGNSMSSAHPEKPEAIPLYYAARHGFCDLAEHLIAKHPEDVNARSGYGATPMHAAALAGHANVLSLLTHHGADVNGRGAFDETPLHEVAGDGRLDIGQILLDSGADINAGGNGNYTPLSRAAYVGHVEFARMLLERGAVIDAPDSEGRTPLHWAVGGGNTQAVRLLLEYGAVIDAPDHSGQTPLHRAVGEGETQAVQLLLEHGAVIDAPDSEGQTPLHWAVGKGKTQAVRLLLEHGADVNARDESGKTPSQLESGLGHPSHEIVEMLSQYGAESVKQ